MSTVSLRRVTAALVTFSAAVALVGCASESPEVPQQSDAPGYVSDYVAPEPTALAPLRGVSVESGVLAHAAVSAKIDNHPEARPQIGLEHTDIVFEELVEGGITRYVAVWHSDVPDLLGPIRSIRPMDPEIVGSFGGIIFYSGGQPRFVQMMQATSVYNAIHGSGVADSYMYRAGDRRAPHNVIVRAQEFLETQDQIEPPQQHFAFAFDAASSSAAKGGSPTGVLQAIFSNAAAPSWEWDATSGRFLRSQNGAPDTDAAGDQLAATNVVALTVPVTHGYGLPKTELIGSGEAWVSSGGATIRATWSKPSLDAPVSLVDEHGVTVRLAPGNTWVELVPNTGSVTVFPPA